jgi:thiamine kinase-like enzyme
VAVPPLAGAVSHRRPAAPGPVAAEDWDHPSVAVWPAGLRQRLRRLHADHSRPAAIAASAERTLCHLDVWPANLIEAEGTSVLFDWSFTGDGAVGEDAG